MLALPYTARKCERSQLRMRAISSSKHTKLKSTKIYSKGVLVNHTQGFIWPKNFAGETGVKLG